LIGAETTAAAFGFAQAAAADGSVQPPLLVARRAWTNAEVFL